MDGIDQIILHIKTEARTERERLAEETTREIEEIRTRYKQFEQEAYGLTLKAGAAEGSALYEQSIATSRQEADTRFLSEKRGITDKAYALAEENLRALPGTKYVAVLAKYAVKKSVSGEEALVFEPDDRQRFAQRVADAANAILREENRTARLTFSDSAIAAEDVDNAIVCTVGRLLDDVRDELETEVSSLLFD